MATIISLLDNSLPTCNIVFPLSVLSKMATEGEEALTLRSNCYLSNEEDLEVLCYIDQEELSIFFILFVLVLYKIRILTALMEEIVTRSVQLFGNIILAFDNRVGL